MPQFTKWGETWIRQDGDNLYSVSDPETIKGLKSGQLPYASIETSRPLSFSVPKDNTSNQQNISETGDTDYKAMLGKLLQKQLTNFQGVSNSAQLEERRQALLRQRLLSSPGKYAPGGDVSALGAAGASSALESAGSEFEPAIQSLQLQINTAKQGDEAAMNNLIKLFSLGKDIGLFGGEDKHSPAYYEWKDAVSAGYKGDLNQYMNDDANRKAKAAGAGGLSVSVLTKVTTIANQHDSNQLVKDYNTIQNKSGSMQKVLKLGVGGPGDLALVFEFMKALDPTSVVRETEYATAAKSGNIFAGIFAKFNGYLKEEGGFLPPQVQDSFIKIMKTKLNVAQKQYDNYHNEQARKINKITGLTDGIDYLTDYGKVNFDAELNKEGAGNENKLRAKYNY